MFEYCTRILHLSEHEASVRITVARCCRLYPLALAMLRSFVRWLILYRGRFELVTDGRRHYRRHPGAALELLGAVRL